MAKIIQLPVQKDSLVQMLERLIVMVEEGELQSLYMAGKLTNGEVAIADGKTADAAERLYLVSHMQIDVMRQAIDPEGVLDEC